MKNTAKFCGSCGTKVADSASVGSPPAVDSIKLTPLPAGLAICGVKINSVSAEGPDADGDLRIEVNYEVANKSDGDWEHLSVHIQLLNAAGQIVAGTQDIHEQSFDAGEIEKLQASFYSVKAKLLGENPEKVHVVISAVASELVQQKLGQVDIPENAFEVTALTPTKLGSSAQLISGSLWKTAPDAGMDSRVEVTALLQNLSDKSLPLVRIRASVNDKKGNEVADASGSDEVRPYGFATVSGTGYIKDKKLVGAKVDLAILAYSPVASGITQRCGLTFVEVTSIDPDPRESISDAQTDDLEGNEQVYRSPPFDELFISRSDEFGVPTSEEIDPDSLEYRLECLLPRMTPDDSWFPDAGTGHFSLPDGTRITTSMDDIDSDVSLFFENFDEMIFHRDREYNGIKFSDGSAVIDMLEKERNMYHFTYEFDINSVATPSSTANHGSIDQKFIIRFCQFGEGNVCGWRIDISDQIDREWLGDWIEKVKTEEWRAS